MANLSGKLSRACIVLTTHIDLTSIPDPGGHQSALLIPYIHYWSIPEIFDHNGGILSCTGLVEGICHFPAYTSSSRLAGATKNSKARYTQSNLRRISLPFSPLDSLGIVCKEHAGIHTLKLKKSRRCSWHTGQ